MSNLGRVLWVTAALVFVTGCNRLPTDLTVNDVNSETGQSDEGTETKLDDENPTTRMETFVTQPGSIFLRAYSKLGSVVSAWPIPGSISVGVIELFDVRTGGRLSGVLVELMEISLRGGGSTSSSVVFIDQDEIDDLIAGLQYIYEPSMPLTAHENHQMIYSTRGGLSATAFLGDDGKAMTVRLTVGTRTIQLGRKEQEVEQFLSFVSNAKEKLDTQSIDARPE